MSAQFEGLDNVPAKTLADAKFLEKHGWRFMTRSRYKYGWHYYWEHDVLRKRTGYWWTQGEAVRFQKYLNKKKRDAEKRKPQRVRGGA